MGPRSILLLLGGVVLRGTPLRVYKLNVAQQISARAAVAHLIPRGYPPAIHAALHLMIQSGGGEGEIEEAEDFGAVAAGANAIAVLGLGADLERSVRGAKMLAVDLEAPPALLLA